SGGSVFVPDCTGGRVWIVDLHDLHVIARPQVLPVQTRFQLLARDGVVFFNDPQSEHAGVLQLDGGVRLVAKYDPRHPGAGLTTGGGGDSPQKPPTTPDDPKAPPKPDTPKPDTPKPDQPNPPPPPPADPGAPQPNPSPSSSA